MKNPEITITMEDGGVGSAQNYIRGLARTPQKLYQPGRKGATMMAYFPQSHQRFTIQGGCPERKQRHGRPRLLHQKG